MFGEERKMYKILKRQEVLGKGRNEVEEMIKSARQLKSRELLSSKGGADHPFWVIVSKEISDHVRSWRFIILLGLIALTCLGSLYTSLTSMGEAVDADSAEGAFFFMKLFTITEVDRKSVV